LPRAAPAPGHDRASRFEELYQSSYQDILSYALRRVPRPELAADIVADTFLVAWRRLDEIPTDQARLWLFGVARNVLANHQRSARREHELNHKLRLELSEMVTPEPGERPEIGLAFRSLTETDQELLRLTAWEGLSPEELAVTLGCTANAARIRLHRARKRFAEALRIPSMSTG
jgi:RNA polymerase sigma-70 factor (ECF subfamily)